MTRRPGEARDRVIPLPPDHPLDRTDIDEVTGRSSVDDVRLQRRGDEGDHSGDCVDQVCKSSPGEQEPDAQRNERKELGDRGVEGGGRDRGRPDGHSRPDPETPRRRPEEVAALSRTQASIPVERDVLVVEPEPALEGGLPLIHDFGILAPPWMARFGFDMTPGASSRPTTRSAAPSWRSS